MYAQCSHCGVYNNETDKVCSQCGKLMTLEAEKLKAPPSPPKNPEKLAPHLSNRYYLAPVFGAVAGLLIGIRFAFVQPAAKPGDLFNPALFYCLITTFMGAVGGGILWLMSTGYFNNKHTQHHPNRAWRLFPALLFILVPFVGLLLALWAKRGNRLPGKAKNTADVILMISATISVVVILVVVIVNMIPPK